MICFLCGKELESNSNDSFHKKCYLKYLEFLNHLRSIYTESTPPSKLFIDENENIKR